MSGEGARIAGGRYNPPESFPTLYLCTSMECVVAEFERVSGKHPAGRGALLPRELYEYEFRFQKTLDLTAESVLSSLSIATADLIARPWDLCQNVGQAAQAVGFQAIRAPSATGFGDVLCVFPENIGAGMLVPRLLTVWQEPPTSK